jgi:hypothetical protein
MTAVSDSCSKQLNQPLEDSTDAARASHSSLSWRGAPQSVIGGVEKGANLGRRSHVGCRKSELAERRKESR